MVNFFQKWCKINLGTLNVPSSIKNKKGGNLLSKNGNGHRGLYNPVKIFIRLIQGGWKKRDEVSGETYLVDSEVVESDLDDIRDQPVGEDNIDN